MIRYLVSILSSVLIAGVAAAEIEPISIPLDQIWAYRMPGTRDVRKLAETAQLSQPIGVRVGGPPSFMLREGKKVAGPGFAVLGTGKDALLATHAKTEGEQPQNVFPFGSEISIVFFSHQFGYYVHLHRVEQHGNVIKIWYRFVPHDTKNLSSHFALIHLGRLVPGRYDVDITRSPMEKQFVEAGFKSVTTEQEQKVVCKSFSFTVLTNHRQ